MNISRLFRVLVVGGAVLGGGVGCATEGVHDPDPGERAVHAPRAIAVVDGEVDSGAVTDAATAPLTDAGSSQPDATATALENCGVCPNDTCCELDDDGDPQVIEGFECCWGTTC